MEIVSKKWLLNWLQEEDVRLRARLKEKTSVYEYRSLNGSFITCNKLLRKIAAMK